MDYYLISLLCLVNVNLICGYDTSKTYVILEINDQNMVVCELHDNNDQSFLGPKFSIPYTFNESITENTLTLKIYGTYYTLQYYPNTANTTIFLPQ